MRDLLFNRSYRPLERYEYYDYRDYRQRNQTYYGRDTATQAPKYGTSGTTTQERYSGSTFAKRRRLQDSKFAASPAAIAIRSTPRRWPATRTPITARANSAPVGPNRSRVPHRLRRARTGPRPRPIGPLRRAAVRDEVSGVDTDRRAAECAGFSCRRLDGSLSPCGPLPGSIASREPCSNSTARRFWTSSLLPASFIIQKVV